MEFRILRIPRRASSTPHAPQKREPTGSSVWHLGHLIRGVSCSPSENVAGRRAASAGVTESKLRGGIVGSCGSFRGRSTKIGACRWPCSRSTKALVITSSLSEGMALADCPNRVAWQCGHRVASGCMSRWQCGHLLPLPAAKDIARPIGPSRTPSPNHKQPFAPRPDAMKAAAIPQTTHRRTAISTRAHLCRS